MATITEDYVSFEIAKLLKEKGFNEPCNAYWFHMIDSEPIFNDNMPRQVYNNKSDTIEIIGCPTFQMAMKWLREEHNIHIEIFVIKNYDKKICEYTYTIMDLNFPGSDDGIDCCNEYKTYEQACEESIKYCLEHLVR